ARMEQIRDFAAFVKRTRDPGSPAVIAGDFNFSYPAEDSSLFETLVGATNAEKDCAASGACTGDDPNVILRESVDHHFQLGWRAGRLKPGHVAQTFKEPHEGKPLSDHWGLEAHYALSRAVVP